MTGITDLVPAIEMEEGAGARVKRLMPTPFLRHHDPFVMFDEFFVGADAGFPEHPHRGFEIITYMMEGQFIHRDSLGHESCIEGGGLQYITVGRGLVHSEMPGTSGLNHGLQMWVNLSKRDKRIQPAYRTVLSSEIPEHRGDGVRIRFLAGPFGAVQLHTPIDCRDIVLSKNRNWKEELRENWNGLIYVIAGSLKIESQVVSSSHGLIMTGCYLIELMAVENTHFLYLAGRPHGEPIRQWGPFVD